jgi:hypothetical protein
LRNASPAAAHRLSAGRGRAIPLAGDDGGSHNPGQDLQAHTGITVLCRACAMAGAKKIRCAACTNRVAACSSGAVPGIYLGNVLNLVGSSPPKPEPVYAGQHGRRTYGKALGTLEAG